MELNPIKNAKKIIKKEYKIIINSIESAKENLHLIKGRTHRRKMGGLLDKLKIEVINSDAIKITKLVKKIRDYKNELKKAGLLIE